MPDAFDCCNVFAYHLIWHKWGGGFLLLLHKVKFSFITFGRVNSVPRVREEEKKKTAKKWIKLNQINKKDKMIKTSHACIGLQMFRLMFAAIVVVVVVGFIWILFLIGFSLSHALTLTRLLLSVTSIEMKHWAFKIKDHFR